jgi:hypothetical protein
MGGDVQYAANHNSSLPFWRDISDYVDMRLTDGKSPASIVRDLTDHQDGLGIGETYTRDIVYWMVAHSRD